MKDGWVTLKTVRSTVNVADHLTKPKSKLEIEELLKKVGAELEEQFDGSRRWALVEEGVFVHLQRVLRCAWRGIKHVGGSLLFLLSLLMYVCVK